MQNTHEAHPSAMLADLGAHFMAQAAEVYADGNERKRKEVLALAAKLLIVEYEAGRCGGASSVVVAIENASNLVERVYAKYPPPSADEIAARATALKAPFLDLIETLKDSSRNHGSSGEAPHRRNAMPIATRYTNLETGTLDLHGDERDHLGVAPDGLVAVRREEDGRIVVVSPKAFAVPKED